MGHNVSFEDPNRVDEWPAVNADGGSLYGTGTSIMAAQDDADVRAVDGFCGFENCAGVGELVYAAVLAWS